MAITTRGKDIEPTTRPTNVRSPMNKGILLITVILFSPVQVLASLSEEHKAYALHDYTTAAKDFWPMRSDLDRAAYSCTRSVHQDDPDFDAYNEGSSVILFGATPESRSKFHKCMSQKGYPLMKSKS